ncbi:glycosyltransferase family 22 protein [Phanerochaete carnosa HHB-10118-sp]|uniref:Mannosyltransferase n=1 Tax=Phanerochaete carnosa (strain HHB-10118-sp) TaxID=650164 RepID=K5WQ31_PHACS|nr:glycosyltransferase family 22 protein [Phanerochaete carnosa HHB-10118-sp]EKM61314.1 glycosyltransferase family 22 protein [Phanerochaete carnosa HHB-10118-sp]
MSAALDLILLGASWLHVLLAPYTKVEESFNLHATHDVLFYGVGPAALPKYDHFIFPGAVPRTFIGSALLAWISAPAIHLAHWFGLLSSKADIQVVVRLVLATCNTSGFSYLRRSVSHRYGGIAGVMFVLLTITQFHIPFWMGRTLPNMFALLPVNIALCRLWDRAPNATRPTARGIDISIVLLVFASVVFRAEVAVLLAAVVLQALWSRRTSLLRVIKVGLISSFVSIGLTVAIDTYFWRQRPIWPELYGVYFNVVQGKSAEWGVSPFHTYFAIHLPKLLLTSILLAAFGALIDGRVRTLLFPSVMFVFILSFLGHKEWRFLVYVVPTFNVAAARGATYLATRKKSSLIGRLAFLVVVGCLSANLLATVIFSRSSMDNYPGGEALARFNEIYAGQPNLHVHISNLAAQTGASLFQQVNSPPYMTVLGIDSRDPATPWIYNKTEDVTPEQLTAHRKITHAIAEVEPMEVASSLEAAGFLKGSWKPTDVVTSFDRLAFDVQAFKADYTKPWRVLNFVESEKLAILERR